MSGDPVDLRASYPGITKDLPEHPKYGNRDGMDVVDVRDKLLGERSWYELGPRVQPWPIRRGLWALFYSPDGIAATRRANVMEDSSPVTFRNNRVHVTGDESAVLGDGEVRVQGAGYTIYAGKAAIFMENAGVVATHSTINSALTAEQRRFVETQSESLRKHWTERLRGENIADHAARYAHEVGFFNFEDITGSRVKFVLDRFSDHKTGSAFWCDDIQGTGIAAAIGFLRWLELTDRMPRITNWRQTRPLEGSDLRVLIPGGGCGGYGIYSILIHLGIKNENILVLDSGPEGKKTPYGYPITHGREDLHPDRDIMKWEMGKGKPSNISLDDWLDLRTSDDPKWRGTIDAVFDVGSGDTFTHNSAWTEKFFRTRMSPHALAAFMTNPKPALLLKDLTDVNRADIYWMSGNPKLPNPANNNVAFGPVARGTLWAGAPLVTPSMQVAAALGGYLLARETPQDERLRQLEPRWNLVPQSTDTRLMEFLSIPTAIIAMESGIVAAAGGRQVSDIEAFEAEIRGDLDFQRRKIDIMHHYAGQIEDALLEARFGEEFAPLRLGDETIYRTVPKISLEHFQLAARAVGVQEKYWQSYIAEGRVKPQALTKVMKQLWMQAQGASNNHEIARREVRVIAQYIEQAPALALALAIRRLNIRAENLPDKPTVFHRERVLSAIKSFVPNPHKEREDLLAFVRTHPYIADEGAGIPVEFATPADIAQIQTVERTWFATDELRKKFGPDGLAYTRYTELLATYPNGLLVARGGDSIDGYVGYERRAIEEIGAGQMPIYNRDPSSSHQPDGKIFYLHKVVRATDTDAECVAELLMQRLEQLARTNDIEGIAVMWSHEHPILRTRQQADSFWGKFSFVRLEGTRDENWAPVAGHRTGGTVYGLAIKAGVFDHLLHARVEVAAPSLGGGGGRTTVTPKADSTSIARIPAHVSAERHVVTPHRLGVAQKITSGVSLPGISAESVRIKLDKGHPLLRSARPAVQWTRFAIKNHLLTKRL